MSKARAHLGTKFNYRWSRVTNTTVMISGQAASKTCHLLGTKAKAATSRRRSMAILLTEKTEYWCINNSNQFLAEKPRPTRTYSNSCLKIRLYHLRGSQSSSRLSHLMRWADQRANGVRKKIFKISKTVLMRDMEENTRLNNSSQRRLKPTPQKRAASILTHLLLDHLSVTARRHLILRPTPCRTQLLS